MIFPPLDHLFVLAINRNKTIYIAVVVTKGTLSMKLGSREKEIWKYTKLNFRLKNCFANVIGYPRRKNNSNGWQECTTLLWLSMVLLLTVQSTTKTMITVWICNIGRKEMEMVWLIEGWKIKRSLGMIVVWIVCDKLKLYSIFL